MDGFSLFGVARPSPAKARPPARPRGRPPFLLPPPLPHPAAPGPADDILALPHPDWLFHHLAVTGPAADLAAFRRAAAGAGVVPWQFDYDELEETWFHLLAAPPPPLHRTISISGAHILARQLREAVWDRHEDAVSLVGVAKGCCFDLHALLPVPRDILRLGPDAPAARRWLWQHWGTTWTLRHVRPGPADGAFRCSFWSADWTPWPAIAAIRQRWPGLRVDVRPVYD